MGVGGWVRGRFPHTPDVICFACPVCKMKEMCKNPYKWGNHLRKSICMFVHVCMWACMSTVVFVLISLFIACVCVGVRGCMCACIVCVCACSFACIHEVCVLQFLDGMEPFYDELV